MIVDGYVRLRDVCESKRADEWNPFTDSGAGGGTEWMIYDAQHKIYGPLFYPAPAGIK